MEKRQFISSGCSCLDEALKGGFPINYVSLIYGEASTGKTTLVIQSSVEMAKNGLKVLYLDIDQSFSSQRLSQIARSKIYEVGKNIIIFSPEDFNEQSTIIENLENYITNNVCLIVLDSITSLYRASLGSTEKIYLLNRELNRQLAYLAELSLTHALAVIITSQIHTVFNGDIRRIEPLAFRPLSYWSKVILRLSSGMKSSIKKVVIERNLKDESKMQTCYLALSENGFRNYNIDSDT